jgi:hypothetical protein
MFIVGNVKLGLGISIFGIFPISGICGKLEPFQGPNPLFPKNGGLKPLFHPCGEPYPLLTGYPG